MKSKVLVSSILTIALCLSLIAGSTFALFTDSKDVNVAITSGDVEVKATVNDLEVYSAKASDVFEDKYLVDEYDNYYTHDGPFASKTFINGGNAEIDSNGKLVINRITPGDRVDAKIHVENVGDVAMIYRYKVVALDSYLAKGMVITTEDGTPYEALDTFTSEWSAPVAAGAEEITHKISIELPVYAGNEYQTEYDDETHTTGDIKSVEYVITVEAVQSNGDMVNESPYDAKIQVATAAELQAALDNNVDGNYYIEVTADLEGFVTLTQVDGAHFTVNGMGHKFDGSFSVDGQSSDTALDASVTIQNFYFKADVNKAAMMATKDKAYIRLGYETNDDRYTSNVAVEYCSFGDGAKELVGIKNRTGGDYGLTVKGCIANEGTHSLIQLKSVKNEVNVSDCRAYSKNGAHFGPSEIVNISGCIFDVEGYAVRFGDGSTINTDTKKFSITDCILVAGCDDGDAVIIFRGNSGKAELTLVNTYLEGVRQFKGDAQVTIK